jgi:hypothetical protein
LTPQELLNRNLQIECGRMVIEIATLKTQVELLEKSLAEVKAGDSGSPNGAQGADGSGGEQNHG